MDINSELVYFLLAKTKSILLYSILPLPCFFSNIIYNYICIEITILHSFSVLDLFIS